MIKQKVLTLLVLLMTAVSGAWAGAVPPLITIESKDYTSFTSGSQTFDNKVTVTFSGNVSYDSEYGWFSAQERTLTVTAAEGYTITGVRFTNGSGSRFDGEAPFEAILGYDNDNAVYFAKVNGTSIGGDAGVTKIEVFGDAVTPATVAVTGVTLLPTTATLTVGETETLTATVLPGDATDKSVTWSSSNTSVATVSNEGVVTAVAAGEATITVTATNGTDVTTDDQTATCTVTVTAPATPTYTVSLKEGTDDAAKWQGKAGSGEYQALPLEGVAAGTAVTVKYDGRKRVKSVKAVKKAEPFAANEYNETSWDGEKVVLTKKTAASEPTAVADAESDVTWSDGWYTVSGNVTITGTVTLGADTHLILQDGAQLTINGQLNCKSGGYSLYIYGQEAGDGKLNVSNSSVAIFGPYSSGKTIEIHGGEITATSTSAPGFISYGIKMYGGKLTATTNAAQAGGIMFFQGNFDVYGGEVEAINTETMYAIGIMSAGDAGEDILTVYGGKVKATVTGNDSSAIYAKIKSGTPDIKFYFADTEGAWSDGATYSTESAAPANRYAKAE